MGRGCYGIGVYRCCLWLVVPALGCVARPFGDADGSASDATTTGVDPSNMSGDTGDGGQGEPAEPVDGPCAPPCEDPWELNGDLVIDLWSFEGEDFSPFACLTAVHGDLSISDKPDLPPGQLAHFRHLEQVDGTLRLHGLQRPTDLSAFRCLREVDTLSILDMRAVVDASLPNLRWAPHVDLTYLDVLPSFAPDFAGLSTLDIDLSAVADLSGAASWRSLGDAEVRLSRLDVTDLRGIEGLVAGSPKVVGLSELSLTSLRGLETITEPGWFGLFDLPALTDISALSGITRAGGIGLSWLPSLTTHVGLHNLEAVESLLLGDCDTDASQSPAPDLSGFESLLEVDTLELHITGLTSLTGAPKLKSVRALSLHQNPGLSQAAIDAFLAQLAAPPESVDIFLHCSNGGHE